MTLSAQKSFEGRLKFQISYELGSEDQKGIEQSLPKECRLYTNGHDWRMEQVSALGYEIVKLYHSKTDSLFKMMEFGQDNVIVANKISDTVEKAWFERTNERRSIVGLDCQKFIAQTGQVKHMVWVSEEFKNLPHLFWSELEGLPISFTTNQSELETHYTLVSYSLEPIDETYFYIPDGYDRISENAYQKLLR